MILGLHEVPSGYEDEIKATKYILRQIKASPTELPVQRFKSSNICICLLALLTLVGIMRLDLAKSRTLWNQGRLQLGIDIKLGNQ
jgi:hypothetical protein